MWAGFFGIWVLYQCMKQPEQYVEYTDGGRNGNYRSERCIAVLLKALTNLVFICFAMCSFQNAIKAEMNIGIIGSLFASEAIFSSLLFLIFYCRAYYLLDILGTLAFIAGAVLIYLSMHPPLAKLIIELDSKNDHMHTAFFYAVACGLTLALSNLITRASWHNMSPV